MSDSASAGGLRAAVVGALAIDRSAFAPGVALRGAAGVAVPFAIGVAAGHTAEGSIAAAGALPAGLAGLSGGFRSRVGIIAAAAVAMALSTFVGGLVAGHTAPTIGVLVLWGFAAGLLVVLGRDATIVGTQAVMGLVVFGRFPGSVASSAVHAGFVLAGGGFQALLAAAIRSPKPYAAQRRTLALAYQELAELADDPDRTTLTAAAEAAMSESLVGRLAPGDDVDLLRSLADEANRIRLELQALATVGDVEGIPEVRQLAGQWLRASSEALQAGDRAPSEDPALAERIDRLRTARETALAGRAGSPARFAAARASALLGQLRAVDRLTNALAGVRRLALHRRGGTPVFLELPQRAAMAARQLESALRTPSSAAFRHAVRLAVILAIAEALGHVLPWQRGYWITLTAVVVLRPDYASTAQRGLARVGGTALGVMVSGLLLSAFHPAGAVLAVLVAIATWAAYTTFAASYALYSFAVTAIVVLLLTPLGGNELTTVADRGLDTIVGGVLAMIGYAAWPSWERETLATSTARLLDALGDYAAVVLRAYADPDAVDRSEVGEAAAAARAARITAQASLDRAVAEPARAGADTAAARGVLAATRRIVMELHALRATLDDASEHVALPEVTDIAAAIAGALHDLAARNPAAVAGLRDLQEHLDTDDADPGSLRARRRALLAAHLDPLVDSVDTIAHVLTVPDA
jgi:uncharacterized membrane protein YccC